MWITIKESGHRGFKIPIPMCFIGLGISIASKASKKNINEDLNKVFESMDSRELKRAFRKLNRTCKGMTIVDVESKEGDHVKIVI
ncbi:hypothetical protein [Clostridium ihumii]|uniref:hypothetical protein n=1 Tax=Clostridium ihumii TaxID=1470356 RepID=UPI003D32D4FB